MLSAGKFYSDLFGTGCEFYFEDIKGDLAHEVLDLSPFIGSIEKASSPSMARRLISKLEQALPVSRFTKSGIHTSNGVGYDSTLISPGELKYVRGYFQSHLYASYVFGESRTTPELRNPPSSWFVEARQDILSRDTAVLHLRLGDYKALSSSIGSLDAQYYEIALRELENSMDVSNLIVVSDEPALAKDILRGKLPHGANFLRPPADSRPVETLILISRAKGVIVANSSFSWWGTFFGEPKFVIAPKPWYRDIPEPLNLLPESWIRRDSKWSIDGL
jgi:hypothetical protein